MTAMNQKRFSLMSGLTQTFAQIKLVLALTGFKIGIFKKRKD